MAHKIGLKLWSTNTGAYLREAARLHEAGMFDYLELYVVPETTDRIAAWKQLRMPFVIHNAHFAHGFNLAKAEMSASNRRIYAQSAQYADMLGAETIIFHGGIDGDINETCRQLAAFGEQRAVIENKPFAALPNRMGGKYCRGATLAEISRVMERAGCGFCLDFGHAVCSASSMQINPYDFIAGLAQLRPRICHLSDVRDMGSVYDAHPHLGTGELDIGRVLGSLPDADLPVSIETDKNSKSELDDFAEDVKFFRSIEKAPANSASQ